MSKEKNIIPQLRFPEFAKDGEWKYAKIENYIELFSGIALKSEEICDDKKGIPILRGINITEGYIRHSKEIDKCFIGDLEKLKKYLIKENDIVIGMDGSKVGKNVALVNKEDENSILIQRVARIRTNKKSDIKYLYQHFLSWKFISYVDTVNTSSGIPHISAKQIKDFKIGLPSLSEQQKIATCLSTLDEVIATHNQKLETLKDHKKGLMQNLFPQEGETVPKYRFPEFVKNGEWVEKKLGKLLEFKNGINASKEQYGKGIKFINVLDILQNEFITYEKIIGFVDVSDEIINKFSVNYGDILFQRSSETQAEVGTANVYLDREQTATFGGFVIRGKNGGDFLLFLGRWKKNFY